jgi:uncharacterized protein YfaT (DUF1175 family)
LPLAITAHSICNSALARYNRAVLRSYTLPAFAAMALAAGFAWRMERPGEAGRLVLGLDSAELPADGFSSATLSTRSIGGELVPAEYRVVEGSRAVRIQGSRLTATVLPGRAVIEGRAKGFRPARISINTRAVFSDRAQDGTPDFLRLDDPADREAFARRFTYLAEAQYIRGPEVLPEISDCAALIRYAYRETLRHAEAVSEPPPQKYQYPFTPLGPHLLRVVPGAFTESDLANRAFAEFADAKTLMLYNSHFVSRDIRRARQGDLLFYKQLDQRLPFHAMIYLGESRFEAGPGARIVYHTGPFGSDKGEIRRPFVAELLSHPQPQWRPVAGNSNFLGVYRWNILKEDF